MTMEDASFVAKVVTVDGNVDLSPAMIISHIIHVFVLLLLLPMPYMELRVSTMIRGIMGESATSSSSLASISSKIPSMSMTKTSAMIPNPRHVRDCNFPLIPPETSALRAVPQSPPQLVGEVPIPRINGVVVAILPAVCSQYHLGRPPRPTPHGCYAPLPPSPVVVRVFLSDTVLTPQLIVV